MWVCVSLLRLVRFCFSMLDFESFLCLFYVARENFWAVPFFFHVLLAQERHDYSSLMTVNGGFDSHMFRFCRRLYLELRFVQHTQHKCYI